MVVGPDVQRFAVGTQRGLQFPALAKDLPSVVQGLLEIGPQAQRGLEVTQGIVVAAGVDGVGVAVLQIGDGLPIDGVAQLRGRVGHGKLRVIAPTSRR